MAVLLWYTNDSATRMLALLGLLLPRRCPPGSVTHEDSCQAQMHMLKPRFTTITWRDHSDNDFTPENNSKVAGYKVYFILLYNLLITKMICELEITLCLSTARPWL